MTSCATDETAGLSGARMAHHFGTAAESVGEFHLNGRIILAVARVSSACDAGVRTERVAPERGFSILQYLGHVAHHCCWAGGRLQQSGPLAAKAVSVADLRDAPQWQFAGAFEALHFYVPEAALQEIAARHGCAPLRFFGWESGRLDPVLWGLSNALLKAAAAEGDHRLLMDQLALCLLTHFAQTYGGLQPVQPSGGSLAPWQERRAREIMSAGLASDLAITDLAAACRLTPSHFARAFRRTTGVAPQRYLMQLRVEEAKKRLLENRLPLSDIALMCGFGDQSHFTRVFRQFTGSPPGAWRRMRSTGCACAADHEDDVTAARRGRRPLDGLALRHERA